jgi:hypothetical protein
VLEGKDAGYRLVAREGPPYDHPLRSEDVKYFVVSDYPPPYSAELTYLGRYAYAWHPVEKRWAYFEEGGVYKAIRPPSGPWPSDEKARRNLAALYPHAQVTYHAAYPVEPPAGLGSAQTQTNKESEG